MDFNSFKNNITKIPTITDPLFLGGIAGGVFFHNEIETALFLAIKPIQDTLNIPHTTFAGTLDSRDVMISGLLWGVGSLVGGQPETILKGVAIGHAIGEGINF